MSPKRLPSEPICRCPVRDVGHLLFLHSPRRGLPPDPFHRNRLRTMRHRNAGRKFKRTPEHRRMLLRNLATALIEHGQIQTTLAKAKEVQPYTEKIITLAKEGWNLNNFRRALAVLTSKQVAFKLF